MKLDIMVMASHPDDAELSCSGTILSHVAKGYKVGVVDLTQGELGTRGSAELRMKEAEEASIILGLSVRENLKFKDGFFLNDEYHLREIIKVIRHYKPEMVIGNAVEDRHPDHGKGAQVTYQACFLSGLARIETSLDGIKQEPWRPKMQYNYIQDRYLKPDVTVDITPFFERKIEAIMAFKSQFFDPNNNINNTYISSPDFIDFIKARAEEMGHAIGVKYGEGFTSYKRIGIENLFTLR